MLSWSSFVEDRSFLCNCRRKVVIQFIRYHSDVFFNPWTCYNSIQLLSLFLWLICCIITLEPLSTSTCRWQLISSLLINGWLDKHPGLEDEVPWKYYFYHHPSVRRSNRRDCSITLIAPMMPSTGRSLQWHHNERDGVSNHRRLDCLLNCLFRCSSKKISKLRVTGFCEGFLPVTGGFPCRKVW